MTHQLLTKPIGELHPDPRNPRLIERPGEHDRESLIHRIWSLYHTPEICRAILDGLYIAPEPMLGLLDSDGHITVVDGNRRLAALTVAHDPAAWRAVKAHEELNNHTHPIKGTPSADVLILDSWDEIHRYRIRRQRNTSRHWNSYVTAHDQRRMMLEGKPTSEIVQTYDYPTLGVGTQRVNTLILALNLTEQLQALRPNQKTHRRDYRRNVDFNRLHVAIQGPNIAQSLGLQDPDKYTPNQKPLKANSESNGLTLATLLWGDTEDERHRQPKVATEHDITQLEDIYADPGEVQKLIEWHHHSIRQASNRLKGHHEMWDVKRQLELLHSVSLSNLKDLKDEGPDLVPYPGDLNVAHTTFTVHNDQSVQYSLHLGTRNPQAHEPARRELEKTLRKSGFPECRVIMD